MLKLTTVKYTTYSTSIKKLLLIQKEIYDLQYIF